MGKKTYSRIVAEFIIKFRVILLIIVGGLSIFFMTRFAGIAVITNLDDFAPFGHPYVKVQKLMEKWFKGGNMVQVEVEVKKGDILNADTLKKILRINRDIMFLDGVIAARLHSIADSKVKMTKGYPDGWLSKRLLVMIPQTPEQTQELKEAILSDELIYGQFVSTDFKAAMIRADFKEDIDYKKLFNDLYDIQQRETDANTIINISGRPIMLGWIDRYQHKLIPLFGVSLLVMGTLLYLCFRTVAGVVLPMVTALISVSWGLGLLAILGYSMDPMAAVIPFLILAIGISHSVQVVKRYYEECGKGCTSKDAAVESVAALMAPALVSVITDAFGFFTMITVKIRMLRLLAIIGTLSLASITFMVLIFLPVCFSFLPTPKQSTVRREEESGGFLNKALLWISNRSTEKKGAWGFMALLAALVVIGLIGTSQMQIGGQAPGAGAFYMSSPYAQETANIAKKFPGAISYSLIIKGSAENDIQRQDVLKNIEHLQDYLNLDPKVGGSLSVIDFLKRMNVVIHEGDERYYHIPRIGDPDIGYYENTEMVQKAVGEYLFMYSLGTAGEFDFLVDYEYKNTNINVFLKDMEAQTIRDIIAKTKDYVAKNWTVKGVTVEIAGGLAGVVGAINEELGTGLVENMLQITAIVFFFCAVLLRSIVGATLIMISLYTRVLVCYGVMGFVGIPLSLYTMPVASLGIGIGVDYVIYVIVRMQEELVESNGDYVKASERALTTTGRAVFFTMMAVVLGCVIFIFSPLKFHMELGLMVGTIIFLNGLGSIIFVPNLAYLVKPKFMHRFVKK
ncbi:MAG: MMPL family transporter [Proteobacteria bacterium]|nr:MMPL family transporter [Pseudomonadota bacterium]